MFCCFPVSLNNEPVKLSSKQKWLVQEVWLEVRHTIDEVGVESFLHFFSTHPEAKDSFIVFKDTDIADLRTSIKLKEHALKVTSVVDKCVARIDDPKAFETICRAHGASHAGRVVTDQFQLTLRDKYIDAIKVRSSVVWDREYQEAWEAFFNLMQFYMMSAMAEANAKQEIK